MAISQKDMRSLAPALERVGSDKFTDFIVHQSTASDPKNQGCRGRFRDILSRQPFDLLMGAIIVFNVVVMIIEIDRSVDEQEGTAGTHWTDLCSWIILVVFILELLLRLHVFRWDFWHDPWNILDFFLVLVDAIFSIVGLLAGSLFPVSVLRIFRLAKLARVSKVLRVFPELRLLIAALLSSITTIFWGAVLLFICLLVWSMAAVLFIHPLNKTIVYNLDDCERCPRAYSSVFNALLTLTQTTVTGDNWGELTLPLLETHPETIPYFASVFLSVGMAVLNLIIGVVVEVAQKAKVLIEQEETSEKALEALKQQTELINCCKVLDSDGDGHVSHDELYGCIANEGGTFRQCMDNLGIEMDDFEIVWQIMDAEAKGKVSYKDLVNQLCSMRSSDTHFMLAYIKYYITKVRNTLLMQMQVIESKTDEAMELEESLAMQVTQSIDKHYSCVGSDRSAELTSSPRQSTPWNGLDASYSLQSSRIGEDDEVARLVSVPQLRPDAFPQPPPQVLDHSDSERTSSVHFSERVSMVPVALDMTDETSEPRLVQSPRIADSQVPQLFDRKSFRKNKRNSSYRGTRLGSLIDCEVQRVSKQVLSDVKLQQTELKEILLNMNRKITKMHQSFSL